MTDTKREDDRPPAGLQAALEAAEVSAAERMQPHFWDGVPVAWYEYPTNGVPWEFGDGLPWIADSGADVLHFVVMDWILNDEDGDGDGDGDDENEWVCCQVGLSLDDLIANFLAKEEGVEGERESRAVLIAALERAVHTLKTAPLFVLNGGDDRSETPPAPE